MLSRFFENLYLKAFINIVVGRTQNIVYIEMCKKDKVVNSVHKIFKTDDNSINDFVDSYIKETPYYYVSVIDPSLSQGAIPTCTKNDFTLFFEPLDSKYVCFENKWIYYTSKSDLLELKKSSFECGIDFIFSPFLILSNFFKDKIDTHIAMYILIEENTLSLTIFENSELLYAQHLNLDINSDLDELSIDESSTIDLEEDLDGEIDLDGIDALDDMDILDDFGDIEDLDAIEDIDEFAESRDMEEEITQEADELPLDDDSEGFNEDYQRFLLIQSSVNNFYKDKKYKSTFIETTYIADSIGISTDLKKYLEEEMFLTTYIRHIDLNVELCDIAKREIKS